MIGGEVGIMIPSIITAAINVQNALGASARAEFEGLQESLSRHHGTPMATR